MKNTNTGLYNFLNQNNIAHDNANSIVLAPQTAIDPDTIAKDLPSKLEWKKENFLGLKTKKQNSNEELVVVNDEARYANDIYASADFGANGFISFAETIGVNASRNQEDTALCQDTSLETSDQAAKFLANAYNEIGVAARQKKEAIEQGSCAITAAITKDGKLTVANAGDSQVVVYVKNNKTKEVKSVQLNTLHKPNEANERERIEDCGGKVEEVKGVSRVCQENEGRFTPVLAIARAFGDKYLKGNGGEFLISYKPEITCFDLNPYLNDEYEVFVEVSCDGLREGGFGESQVTQKLKSQNINQDIANSVLEDCSKVSLDNQTAFIIKVPTNLKKLEKGLLVAVNDGHGGKAISNLAANKMSELNQNLKLQALPNLPEDIEFRNVDFSPNYMFLKIGIGLVLAVGLVCLLRSQTAANCFNSAINSSLGKSLSENVIGKLFSKINCFASRA